MLKGLHSQKKKNIDSQIITTLTSCRETLHPQAFLPIKNFVPQNKQLGSSQLQVNTDN